MACPTVPKPYLSLPHTLEDYVLFGSVSTFNIWEEVAHSGHKAWPAATTTGYQVPLLDLFLDSPRIYGPIRRNASWNRPMTINFSQPYWRWWGSSPAISTGVQREPSPHHAPDLKDTKHSAEHKFPVPSARDDPNSRVKSKDHPLPNPVPRPMNRGPNPSAHCILSCWGQHHTVQGRKEQCFGWEKGQSKISCRSVPWLLMLTWLAAALATKWPTHARLPLQRKDSNPIPVELEILTPEGHWRTCSSRTKKHSLSLH